MQQAMDALAEDRCQERGLPGLEPVVRRRCESKSVRTP